MPSQIDLNFTFGGASNSAAFTINNAITFTNARLEVLTASSSIFAGVTDASSLILQTNTAGDGELTTAGQVVTWAPSVAHSKLFGHLAQYRLSLLIAGVWTITAFGNLRIDGAADAIATAAGGTGGGGGASTGREILLANRTYYIRADGSDSNTGLVDSAGGGFLTIQKFIDVVAKAIDLGGFNVTGQVRAGTFAGCTVAGPWTGAGTVSLTGDAATPSNVVISSVGFNVNNGGSITLSGFKTSIAATSHISVTAESLVTFSAWEFGICTSGKHINADTGAKVLCTVGSVYTISGNAQSHIAAGNQALVSLLSGTVTLTGTPAFSQGFANATGEGTILISAITFSGAATGARFNVGSEGNIDSLSTKVGLTGLPGNSAGTISIGGLYMGLSAQRERLTANRTYFIRSDGSDSNDGLVNSAAGAFLTIQKFFDTVGALLDIGNFTVTGSVATGTFAGGTVNAPWVGTGAVVLQGNTGTPSNCVLTSTIKTQAGASLTVKGFRSTGAAVPHLWATGESLLTFGQWEFATTSDSHIVADQGSRITNISFSYAITAGADCHFKAILGGSIYIGGITVTLTGTPAFVTAFAQANDGTIENDTVTYSGAATGTRFLADKGGIITSPAGNITLTTFPGSSAGIWQRGALYDGLRSNPPNSISTAYTTVLQDMNGTILHPAADTTARVWTIDSNANVPYPVGAKIEFINQNAAGTLTLAITADTMRLAGAGTTGSRTLAANGVAIATKIAATEWIISGTGLT